MGSPPRLCALRLYVQTALKNIFDLDFLLPAGTDLFPENFFDVPADDKDYFVESGFDGVVNRIIDNDMAGGINAFELFDTPAVAGTDAGSHYQKCCVHWCFLHGSTVLSGKNNFIVKAAVQVMAGTDEAEHVDHLVAVDRGIGIVIVAVFVDVRMHDNSVFHVYFSLGG